jgi:hypothetical protein
MKAAQEIGTLCRIATARMPTKWGMFKGRRIPILREFGVHRDCVRL